MDQLARDLLGQTHFLFIYVREAHPDDYPQYPAHRTLEQKFQRARELAQRHKTPRAVLVDTLDGDIHRVYGGRPNMSWIIDHTGRVVYKADWTVAADIRTALQDVLRIRELKREGQGRFKDYYRETISALQTARRSAATEQEAGVRSASG